MRFLIVNTDYPVFLRQHYAQRPELAAATHEEQMAAQAAGWFSVTDSYTHALRELGHAVDEIHANNVFAQHAWARQHAPHLVADVPAPSPDATRLPWTCQRGRGGDWLVDLLVEQVRQLQPRVLLNQAMDCIPPAVMRELRPHVPTLVGQHAASPLDEALDWRVYDLCVSSFPPRVEWFRAQGVRGELSRLAFDARALAALPAVTDRDVPLSFVGSFFDIHRSRTRLLERVAERFPLAVWGPQPKEGFGDSALARCYRGEAWGLDMLAILRRSQVTINHHGDVPPFANNFRLYEATGAGAMLLTDWKPNLHEMFDVGREVAAYRDEDECLALIDRYLTDAPARESIARAGHRRTLREHTFLDRMNAFASLFD